MANAQDWMESDLLSGQGGWWRNTLKGQVGFEFRAHEYVWDGNVFRGRPIWVENKPGTRNGKPRPNAEIILDDVGIWEYSRKGTSQGRYVLCQIPKGRPYELTPPTGVTWKGSESGDYTSYKIYKMRTFDELIKGILGEWAVSLHWVLNRARLICLSASAATAALSWSIKAHSELPTPAKSVVLTTILCNAAAASRSTLPRLPTELLFLILGLLKARDLLDYVQVEPALVREEVEIDLDSCDEEDCSDQEGDEDGDEDDWDFGLA